MALWSALIIIKKNNNMEFKDIVAVSSLPGLYAIERQRPDGLIVKGLADKKNRFVSNRIHTFSPLDKIAIYTFDDSVELVNVMKAMQEKAAAGELKIPSPKVSSKELKSFFGKVLADYDEDRVYVSDIKKVIKWYNILESHGIAFELPQEEKEAEEQQKQEEETAEINEAKTETSEESTKTQSTDTEVVSEEKDA